MITESKEKDYFDENAVIGANGTSQTFNKNAFVTALVPFGIKGVDPLGITKVQYKNL